MQQDADECWTNILHSLRDKLKVGCSGCWQLGSHVDSGWGTAAAADSRGCSCCTPFTQRRAAAAS